MWERLLWNLLYPNGRNGRWTHALLTGVLFDLWFTVANLWPRGQRGVVAEVVSVGGGAIMLGCGYLGIVNSVRRLNDLGLSGVLAPLGLVPFVNFAFYAFVLFAPARWGEGRRRRRIEQSLVGALRDIESMAPQVEIRVERDGAECVHIVCDRANLMRSLRVIPETRCDGDERLAVPLAISIGEGVAVEIVDEDGTRIAAGSAPYQLPLFLS